MDIFLSAEIEGRAESKWFILQKEFSEKLKKLSEYNYGDNLTSIAIISIIMREEFFEDWAYKERKYYSKKNKEADIRLRINYKKFIIAKEDERRKIYFDHILESIRIAGEKAGSDFRLDNLLSDVNYLLN